jgi:hypothetical protein
MGFKFEAASILTWTKQTRGINIKIFKENNWGDRKKKMKASKKNLKLEIFLE